MLIINVLTVTEVKIRGKGVIFGTIDLIDSVVIGMFPDGAIRVLELGGLKAQFS